MAADDDSSDLSSLSSLSPVPSDAELDDASDAEVQSPPKGSILKFFPKLSAKAPKEPSPPPRKREPSPPHEYVLADNPDIAFIVMFRNRFSDVFPKSLAHFGPQELERDVVEPIPGDRVEHFLCAILGLLLNRKQDVKPGHYGRALEDAVTSHRNQWAPAWEDKNPLSGGANFNSMTPTERLTLLRTLILWSMSSSEAVKTAINQAYKQNRHEDDINQPKSVQPWGGDGDRRRYFLVEGQDDTGFRVYRESNPQGTNRTWFSVAGSIDELRALSTKLETNDGGPKAKKLSQRILGAIPRFEAGDEKRKRREYRQMRKEQFKRPEPGFSLYEGRTRGKRMKYTYSDDEDIFGSDSTTRRSARNTGTHTPAETGPVTTSSGRQIRAPTRLNAGTGDSAPASVHGDTSEVENDGPVGRGGRPRRAAAINHGSNGWDGDTARSKTNEDSDEEESEAEFGDDEDDVDVQVPEESEDEDEDEFDEDEAMEDEDLDTGPTSHIVKLSVSPPKLRTLLDPTEAVGEGRDTTREASPSARAKEAKPDVTDGSTVDMTAAVKTTINAASPPKPPVPGGGAEALGNRPPSAVAETALAFRGSPEKPQPRALP
jgi:hypothetical protein